MSKAAAAFKPSPVESLAGVKIKLHRQPRAMKTIDVKQPPAELAGKALDEWNRLGKELAEANQLAAIDRNVLALYCQIYARWVGAEEKVTELGPVVASATQTPMANPYLRVVDQCIRQLCEIGDRMGLSPAARNELRRKL